MTDDEGAALVEANMVRSFMQGTLYMFCHSGLRQTLRVDYVEQGVGEDGIYLPYFVVQTESGIRIRVGLEVLP